MRVHSSSSDDFMNHWVHDELLKAITIVTNIERDADGPLDIEIEFRIVGLLKLFRLIEATLKTADPGLVRKWSLDQIDNGLQQLKPHISAYISSGEYDRNVEGTIFKLCQWLSIIMSLNPVDQRAESILKDVTDKANTATERLADVESEITGNIAAEKLRSESYDVMLTDLSSQTDKFKSKVDVAKENIAKEELSMKELRTEVRKLVGLVASDTISGAHQANAAREDKEANKMTYISFGLVALSLGIMGFLKFYAPITDGDIGFISNFGIYSILVAAFAFTIRQSGLHRRQAIRHRQFHLEMEALDPYLSEFERAERLDVKKELVPKLFGHADDHLPSARGGEHLITRVINEFRKAFKKSEK